MEKTRTCHISQKGRINFQTPPRAVPRHAVRRDAAAGKLPHGTDACGRAGRVSRSRSLPYRGRASPAGGELQPRPAAPAPCGTPFAVCPAPGLQHKPHHRSTPSLKVLPKTTNKAVRGKDAESAKAAAV